jgi:copper chaperone CopZ
VRSSLDGVRIDRVKIGEATIGYEPRQITPSEIAEAINEAGYQAELTGRAI